MQRFDAIVVGAGPAGSVTAYRLARAGASVLLLDRARFPRDKPCGGGLTIRAVRRLPFVVDPVVEDVVDRVELGLGYTRRYERPSPNPLILMTQRARLDAYLAEQAVAAGAEFQDATRVARLEQDASGVSVDGIRADALVGADGANGVTARLLGLCPRPAHGVALEGNLSHEHVDATRYRNRIVLELGTVRGGYGWVFCKGDHVNIGVGGWEREAPGFREELRRLCAAHGLDHQRLQALRGYRLPIARPGAPLARGRALVVGDAAGLVDPLSGDGIYEAFVSARLAAEAIVKGDLAAYADALAAALDHHATASWAAKRALERSAAACFWAARSPGVFGVVAGLLGGSVRHPNEARGLARVSLRALARLAARPTTEALP